jgi:hypothetical protein
VGPEQLIKMATGNFADAYGMRPAQPMATPVLQATPWTIATERPVPTPRLGSCEVRLCRVDSELVPAVATPATLQSVRQRPPAIALDPRFGPSSAPVRRSLCWSCRSGWISTSGACRIHRHHRRHPLISGCAVTAGSARARADCGRFLRRHTVRVRRWCSPGGKASLEPPRWLMTPKTI